MVGPASPPSGSRTQVHVVDPANPLDETRTALHGQEIIKGAVQPMAG
jgi:hypothetical protein